MLAKESKTSRPVLHMSTLLDVKYLSLGITTCDDERCIFHTCAYSPVTVNTH